MSQSVLLCCASLGFCTFCTSVYYILQAGFSKALLQCLHSKLARAEHNITGAHRCSDSPEASPGVANAVGGIGVGTITILDVTRALLHCGACRAPNRRCGIIPGRRGRSFHRSISCSSNNTRKRRQTGIKEGIPPL